VEVEREVVGEHLLLEDVVEQLFVARAQEDGVVRHVFVLPVGAEVPDEEGHGVARALDARVGPGRRASGATR
jgi:hypothetical protein